MKKLTLISLISALTCSSLVHAGGMGEQSGLCCTAFVALEGGYSTASFDNYNFDLVGAPGSISSIKKNQNYAGRLGAGGLAMMDEQFGVTAELGWGYYGKVTLDPNNLDFGELTIQRTLTGFDALLGVAFVQPSYSLFFKAGALMQNMTTTTTATDNFAIVADTISIKTNQTAALPEIKLGGSYNFDNNWGITAAYMLAYGSSSRTHGTFNVNTGETTLYINNVNPTTNTFLLGIQYTV